MIPLFSDIIGFRALSFPESPTEQYYYEDPLNPLHETKATYVYLLDNHDPNTPPTPYLGASTQAGMEAIDSIFSPDSTHSNTPSELPSQTWTLTYWTGTLPKLAPQMRQDIWLTDLTTPTGSYFVIFEPTPDDAYKTLHGTLTAPSCDQTTHGMTAHTCKLDTVNTGWVFSTNIPPECSPQALQAMTNSSLTSTTDLVVTRSPELVGHLIAPPQYYLTKRYWARTTRPDGVTRTYLKIAPENTATTDLESFTALAATILTPDAPIKTLELLIYQSPVHNTPDVDHPRTVNILLGGEPTEDATQEAMLEFLQTHCRRHLTVRYTYDRCDQSLYETLLDEWAFLTFQPSEIGSLPAPSDQLEYRPLTPVFETLIGADDPFAFQLLATPKHAANGALVTLRAGAANPDQLTDLTTTIPGLNGTVYPSTVDEPRSQLRHRLVYHDPDTHDLDASKPVFASVPHLGDFLALPDPPTLPDPLTKTFTAKSPHPLNTEPYPADQLVNGATTILSYREDDS